LLLIDFVQFTLLTRQYVKKSIANMKAGIDELTTKGIKKRT